MVRHMDLFRKLKNCKMERKIGEVFDYEGIELKVVKETSACDGCYFNKPMACEDRDEEEIGCCINVNREDDADVIFQEVEV